MCIYINNWANVSRGVPVCAYTCITVYIRIFVYTIYNMEVSTRGFPDVTFFRLARNSSAFPFFSRNEKSSH